MPLLSTVYCSIAEVQRYLSTQGATNFADHDDDGTADTDVIEDCINQATEEIDMYLLPQYTQANLDASTLVNRWCVTMATKFLGDRRGNPPPASVVAEFDRIADPFTGLLAQIADRKRTLPGVSKRAELVPTMSNLKIDRRHRISTVRKTQQNSSSAPSTQTEDFYRDLPSGLL
jgi:phage gp36-like protein